MSNPHAVKRSVYLDESQKDAIQEQADEEFRSWSGHAEWLLRLSMHAKHLLPKAPPGVEEGHARCYLYPKQVGPELDALLSELRHGQREEERRWTFSALVRELLALGFQIYEEHKRHLQVEGARLRSLARRTPRALAMTLSLQYDADELVGLLAGPPRGTQSRWGKWVKEEWSSVVDVAIRARAVFDELEERR